MRYVVLLMVAAASSTSACGGAPRGAPSDASTARRLPAPPVAEPIDANDTLRPRDAEARRDADLARAREQAIAVELYAITEAEHDGRVVNPALAPALEADRQRAENRAIDGYTLLVGDPELATWPSRPHALFTLAQMLRARGDELPARDRYLELVTTYPRASDAATAHLALAEIAFAHEELGKALRSCDAALATPGLGEDQRISALYMKAWTLRGLGDAAEPHALERAMEALRQVIELAARVGGTSKTLGDSAEGELVQLFAEHGDPRAAEDFFHPLGARTEDRMLAALRARYARTGE